MCSSLWKHAFKKKKLHLNYNYSSKKINYCLVGNPLMKLKAANNSIFGSKERGGAQKEKKVIIIK